MGQIKTWWRKLPIPIAFVMCSLAFILLALFLEKYAGNPAELFGIGDPDGDYRRYSKHGKPDAGKH